MIPCSPGGMGGEVPTASIVIPVFNQVAYTRQCLEHLGKYTDVPYELVIIDNASTDGTAAVLQGVRATVLTNATNLGCAAAWTRESRRAAGAVWCSSTTTCW